MAMPPTDVSSSELFRRLTEAPRPSDLVDFPRLDPDGRPIAKVRLQVLNMREHDDARVKAHMWLKAKRRLKKEDFDGLTIQQVLADRVARELLAIACLRPEAIEGTDPPKYMRIFTSADQLDMLSASELEVLFMSFQMVQHRWGPYDGNLDSEEQVSAWMRRLVEGASAYPLSRCSWHQLCELTMSLAERAYTLCAILASHGRDCASGLGVDLSSWGVGIISFGVRPASAIEAGITREQMGISGDEKGPPVTDEELDVYRGKVPTTPITLRDAARLCEDMFKGD